MALGGRFLAQNSVLDQNSKYFLEKNKYFLDSEPVFEKKQGENVENDLFDTF